MYLYGYIAIRLCVYKGTSGVPTSVFLVIGSPMRWMLSHVVMFVRGGDGTLARTRVVAPGCAGEGCIVLRKFHPHPTCPHALTGYTCRPVLLRGCEAGGANG